MRILSRMILMPASVVLLAMGLRATGVYIPWGNLYDVHWQSKSINISLGAKISVDKRQQKYIHALVDLITTNTVPQGRAQGIPLVLWLRKNPQGGLFSACECVLTRTVCNDKVVWHYRVSAAWRKNLVINLYHWSRKINTLVELCIAWSCLRLCQ